MKKSFASVLFFGSSLAALAQEAAPAPAGSTFAELFEKGGPLMWVLAGLSVIALAVVVYLLLVLRESATVPYIVMADVMDRIQKGDLDGARKVCEYRRSPFANVARAALTAAQNLPDGDSTVLSSVVEGEGARQAERLQSGPQWLLDIASIAPMVGLLGTVLGMLTAFQGVGGEMVASAKPVVLAQGVSLALLTTIAGLVVAIPCMALYALFRRRAQGQIAVLECAASDLTTLILLRRAAKPAPTTPAA